MCVSHSQQRDKIMQSLGDALELVLELAEQNIIDDPDMVDETERQTEACERVRNLVDLFDDQEKASGVGKEMIAMTGIKTIQDGPETICVKLLNGWGIKTQAGFARTIFNLFDRHTK